MRNLRDPRDSEGAREFERMGIVNPDDDVITRFRKIRAYKGDTPYEIEQKAAYVQEMIRKARRGG